MEMEEQEQPTLEIIFAHPDDTHAIPNHAVVYLVPQTFMTWTDKNQYIGTDKLMQCTGIVLHYPAKHIGCVTHVESDSIEEYVPKMLTAVDLMCKKIDDLKALSGNPKLEIVIIGGQSNEHFRKAVKTEILDNFRTITSFRDTYDLSFETSEGPISAHKLRIGSFAYNPQASRVVVCSANYKFNSVSGAKKIALSETKSKNNKGKGKCIVS